MTNDQNWFDSNLLADIERAERAAPPRPVVGQGFIQQRLASLDAYRGLIMISLAFGGFGLAATANNLLARNPDDPVWTQVQYQFTHTEWVGCSYWDLIQPSFMFMVGAALAYSYAKRKRLGHAFPRMLGHAVWRSLVLILLGIFLISNRGGSTVWSFTNVLTQIGLGYTFLFLLCGYSWRTQAEAAAVLLVGVWLAYFLYPHAGLDLATGAPEAGVSAQWAQQHLADIAPPWHKNANLGQSVDAWLLNLLPWRTGFKFNSGGYHTINFIPSLATMLFGLMCGDLLRSRRSASNKLMILLLAGAAGIALGLVLHWTGFCPLVKRIWTPSWTLFSAGCCCWIMALLFALFDVLPLSFAAYPLVVVGVNSLAIYCMSMLLKPWVAHSLETHLGDQVFRLRVRWGEDLYRLWFMDNAAESQLLLYQPTVEAVMIGLVFWLACWWMYRQRIFVRI